MRLALCHPERKHDAHGMCWQCYHKDYRKIYNPRNTRRDSLKQRYGLTLEHYDALRKQQKGLCAICGSPPRGKRTNLDVDHNHVTKVVRGLLCNPCNKVLGYLENKEWLLKANTYLNSHIT